MGNRSTGWGRRAVLLASLVSTVGIGPILIYGLSATSELVIADLGITEAQFGLLATICFACATIGNASLGRFADRTSDQTLMILIFAFAAVALLLAGIPSGFVLLVVVALFAGLAQSFSNGVTNRILLERVPVRQRINWAGIKQSGIQISQVAASLSFPSIAVVIGWRGASLTAVLVALGLMAVAVYALRANPPLSSAPDQPDHSGASADPPEHIDARDTPDAPDAPAARPNASLALPPFVWALTAFGFLNGLGVQATNVYISLFAVRELGFSLFVGGLTAAVAGVFGVLSRIGWGYVMSRGVSARPILLAIACTAVIGATALFGAGATSSAVLLWTGVLLHGCAALGVSVVLVGALLRSAQATNMASASGIVTAGMFAGFTLGPLVMGALIADSGSFQAGWIFTICSYAGCIVLAAALLARGK